MKKVTLLFFVFTVCSLYLHATDPLQQYVAKYKFPPGSAVSEVNVVLENGVLTLTSAMGNAPIEKTGADTFAITTYNGTAIFKRNEAKKITTLKIDVMGISLEGIRDEKESVAGGSMMPILPVSKSPFPLKYLPAAMLTEGEETEQ